MGAPINKWLSAAVFVSANVGAQLASSEESLFDSANSTSKTEDCTTGSSSITRSVLIENAIKSYGLADLKIAWTGCKVASFKTIALPGFREGSNSFRIYFPKGLITGEYGPPLLHELAHVYQIRSAGSFAALKASTSSARIELGADFLAGIVARRTGGLDTRNYQLSINLVGQYREPCAVAHGSPADRSNAFRLGYFFDLNNQDRTLAAAYQQFQEVIWDEMGLFKSASALGRGTASDGIPIVGCERD